VYADPKCGVSQSDVFMVPPGMEFNCSGNEPASSPDDNADASGTSVFENF